MMQSERFNPKQEPKKVNYVHRFEATGTKWTIVSREALSSREVSEIDEEIERFSGLYSRFRPDSLLNTLNKSSSVSDYPKEFADMLRFSLEAFNKTKGAFDISVGGVLEGLGYGQGNNRANSLDLGESLLIGEKKIRLKRGSSIDFGGFGKGWLIKNINSILKSGSNNYIINGGGDILVSLDLSADIPIAHPYNLDQYIGTLRLSGSGLASSSPALRKWSNEKGEHNHHIDPRTSKPVDSLASVHVVSEDIVKADMLATTFCLIQPSEVALMAKQFGVEYMLIKHDLSFIKSSGFKINLN